VIYDILFNAHLFYHLFSSVNERKQDEIYGFVVVRA
jgi:hypothetical protein